MVYRRFDEDKYKRIFDQGFGPGSFDVGVERARNIGRMRVEVEEAERRRKEAEKQAAKMTFDDALAYVSEPERLAEIKRRGAARVAEDIRNDPRLKEQIKNLGFTQSQYIDAMMQAVSPTNPDGTSTFRSEREYKQYAKGAPERAQAGAEQRRLDREKREKEAAEKAKQDRLQNEGSLWEDLKSFGRMAGQVINPFDDVSAGQAGRDFIDDILSRPRSEFNRELNRSTARIANAGTLDFLNQSSKRQNDGESLGTFQGREGMGAAQDIISDMIGYSLPGAAGYNATGQLLRNMAGGTANTPLRELAGRDLVRRLTAEGARGAGVGAAIGSAEVGIREGLNPDDYSTMQNLGHIGASAAIGGIADAGIIGAGSVLGRSRLGQNLINRMEQPPNRQTPQPETQTQVQNPSAPQDPRITPAQPDELDSILEAQRDIFQRRQAEEDAFIQSRRQEIDDVLNRTVQADQQWQRTKQAKDELKQIKDQYGKIIIPESNWADWGHEIPAGLRAKRGSTQGVDIYRFADDLGLSSPDEAIQYLRQLDQDAKVRLKDVMPDNDPKNEDEAIEALRREFQETDTAKGLDQLLDDLTVSQRQAEQARTNTANSNIAQGQTQSAGATPMSRGIDHRGERAQAQKGSSNVSRTDKVLQRFNDDLTVVKAFEQDVTGRKRFGSSGEFHKSLQVAKGATGRAQYYLKSQVEPIFKKLTDSGRKLENANEYMLAKHLKEVRAQNPNYKLPGGVSESDLDETIRMFEGDQAVNEYVESMKGVYGNLRDILRDAGILSKEQADTMAQMYEHYMPKYRQRNMSPDKFEETVLEDVIQSGSAKPISKLQDGSDLPLMDPVESLVKQVETTMKSAMTNKALQHLEDLAKLDKSGKWIRSENADGGAPVSYFVDGKKKTVYLEKGLAEAINNAKSFELDPMLGIIKNVSRLQRLSITGTPVFTVVNTLKDMMQGWAYSRAGFNPIDMSIAFIDVLSDGKLLKNKSMIQDFYESGAGMNSMWAQDSKAFRDFRKMAYGHSRTKSIKDVLGDSGKASEVKAAQFMGSLLDKYREQLSKAENIVKMAEFRATVRKGGTQDDAAYNARDMFDFFKAGSSTRKANPYVSFLNATIRGRDKFARSLSEPIADGDYGKAISVITKNAILGLGPSAVAWMAYKNLASEDQKKIIEEAPDYLRDTHWLFPHANGKDVIRFPKPFETGAWVSNPIENLLRKIDGQDVDMAEEAQRWILNNVLFDPSLNVLTPLYETATGVDTFTDSSIIPQREQHRDPIDQRDANTSRVAEGIAGAVNTLGSPIALDQTRLSSPRVIDNLIDGYFPMAGAEVSSGIDGILEGLGLVEPRNAPERPGGNRALNIPERFMVRSEGRNTPLIGDLYDAPGKYRNLRDKNDGVMPSHLESNYTEVNKAVNQINDMAGQIRELTNDPNISREEKTQRVNRLIEERNEIIRRLKDQGLLDPEGRN